MTASALLPLAAEGEGAATLAVLPLAVLPLAVDGVGGGLLQLCGYCGALLWKYPLAAEGRAATLAVPPSGSTPSGNTPSSSTPSGSWEGGGLPAAV